MYQTTTCPKQSQKTFMYKNRQAAIRRIIQLSLKWTRYSLSYSFEALQTYQSHTKNNQQKKTIKSIHAQFLSHCATLIQANYKRYIQQKRYIQFLPIYRRFRQLLYAGAEGWRIRRVMKLKLIKTQIKSIKDKVGKGQLNMARIHKREMIDQINRLRKRGRWLQIQQQESKIVERRRKSLNKQNVSLYGNVKSKSIKNIFIQKRQCAAIPKSKGNSRQTVQKIDPRQNVNMVKIDNISTIQSNNSRMHQKNSDEISINTKLTNPYDEIPIKGHKDFYALLEQKCQMPVESKSMTRQKVREKKANRQSKVCKKNEKNQQNMRTQKLVQPQKVDCLTSREDNQSIIDRFQIHSYIEQSEHLPEQHLISTTKQKHSKCQKIKLTLASSKESSARQAWSPSKSNTLKHSKITISEVKQDALPQLLAKTQRNKGVSCISQLLKAYQEVYLQKKKQLVLKIREQEYQLGGPLQ